MDFSNMKDFMDRLTAWRIPGNSISICKEGNEVFSYSSGYSNLEKKIPMKGSELINIYSCSKIVTVVAAMQLYEKGFFLLDDPLYDFIPEFKTMYIKGEDEKIIRAENPITLRQLFTMTSGLSYNLDTPGFEKARKITNGKMNTLEVIKCIAEDCLSFEPGEKWQYGLSHDVLAAVVEVICGKKFRDYVKENIFEPLQMHESFYHNEEKRTKMAEQYMYINSNETDCVKLQQCSENQSDGAIVNVGKDVYLIFGTEYDSGGAGITTTISDFSKFLATLSNWGTSKTGEKILSEGSIELIRTNQLSAVQSKTYDWKQLKGYGYGLGVRTLVDKAVSGSAGSLCEFGWGGAAGATALVDADRGLSMFYAHHMRNPQEDYYQPRLRNVLYSCF